MPRVGRKYSIECFIETEVPVEEGLNVRCYEIKSCLFVATLEFLLSR